MPTARFRSSILKSCCTTDCAPACSTNLWSQVMQHIEALLRKEIGLDAASIGSSLIERTVRLRMKQHGLKRFFDYGKLLQESRTELNQLIEAVVVTETWFFRDREPFT